MGLIAATLLPVLRATFPECGLRTDAPADRPDVIAVIPSPNSELGNLLISDHDREATVYIEKITHGHFNPYDSSLSPEENARVVTEMVVDFLRNVFADRVVFSGDAKRMGGWSVLRPGEPVRRRRGAKLFVWSGPFPTTDDTPPVSV